jgi:hypothetical protein
MSAVLYVFTVCFRHPYRAELFAVFNLTNAHGKGVLCRVPPFVTHGKYSGTRQSQVFP